MPGPSNPGTSPGDPCYLAFRRAIAEGALPFSCQGSENGLAIEGGATLAYEMCDDLAGEGLTSLDRVFIQVGGGALASACVQGFDESILRGRLAWMPRIHAVQTCGGYPLKRAYDLVVDRLLAGLEATAPGTPARFATDDDRARHLQRTAPAPLVEEVFAYARRHRREFMWPWESEPRSVAGGILDDETYDWAVVVEAMVKSGGFPIVVNEATLDEANVLARRSTAVNVDHTGSAGLAGLLALSRSPTGPRPSERVAVLFTGVRRE
jgi:threonine synthase